MKSNGQAEDRRALDELTDAYRLLEAENKRLRAEVERLRGPRPVQKQVEVVRGPAPGQFVEYLPPGGKEGRVPRLALVLEVKPGGVLRLKVKHAAQPDEVLDDVGMARWRAR